MGGQRFRIVPPKVSLHVLRGGGVHLLLTFLVSGTSLLGFLAVGRPELSTLESRGVWGLGRFNPFWSGGSLAPDSGVRLRGSGREQFSRVESLV